MTPVSVRIEPGTTVGPYVLERIVAEGGRSVLYLAHDADSRRVIVKTFPPYVTTASTRSQLMREARALATVDHPGVVRVLATGDHENTSWIAMDYVRGTDLARILGERGPLSIELAFDYAVQIAEALAAAHDAGVIHRDLRPSNLLVSPEGRIVVVDFGIAVRPFEAGDADAQNEELVGTTAYLSPEQLEHGLADERSDVWALGCVLYEMLVGAPPFGKGGAATTAAILHDEPAFPARVAGTPTHLVGVCLRKSSFARVGTMREIVSMLRDAHAEARSKRASVRPSAPPGSSSRIALPRPPSVPPGLPESGSMQAGPRGRVKGTALRAGLIWFAETYGEPGLTGVVSLASADLAAMLRADDRAFGIIASGWYDTLLVGELIGLIERVASPADAKLFGAKVADAIARDNVGGIYRALFRLVAAPALLEANAQRVWRTYIDEGTLTVRMTGPGSFEARVRGWSRHHPSVCRVVRAMMESLFRAVGYGGLVVDRTKCIDRGDPHCQFDGKWTP